MKLISLVAVFIIYKNSNKIYPKFVTVTLLEIKLNGARVYNLPYSNTTLNGKFEKTIVCFYKTNSILNAK